MTKRIQRVNQLIKRELSRILLREMEFPEDTLVTVTRVETSVDLNWAKIYVGVIPKGQTTGVLQMLNRQIYKLQQKLNHLLEMRPVPQIKFLEEKETTEAGRVEELLEKIRIEKKIKIIK